MQAGAAAPRPAIGGRGDVGEDGHEREPERQPAPPRSIAASKRSGHSSRPLSQPGVRPSSERPRRRPPPAGEAHHGGGSQQERVEVAVAHVKPARLLGGGAQLGPAVAPVVAVDDVMSRPQRLIGRDRDDERAAWARDPSQLARVRRSSGVCSMTSRQVTRSNDCVGEGHVLDGAEPGRVAAAARRGHRRVRIDADHGPARRAARRACGPIRSRRIEDPGVGTSPTRSSSACRTRRRPRYRRWLSSPARMASISLRSITPSRVATRTGTESRAAPRGAVRPTSVECAVAQRRTGAQGTAARGEQVPRPSRT